MAVSVATLTRPFVMSFRHQTRAGTVRVFNNAVSRVAGCRCCDSRDCDGEAPFSNGSAGLDMLDLTPGASPSKSVERGQARGLEAPSDLDALGFVCVRAE